MKSLVVIPARYGSTRFPGKPLADICGRPMVRHVYERARSSRLATDVIVATDDERISSAVESFGGRTAMTHQGIETGTDRVRAVAAGGSWDIVVNLQGDEPLIDPSIIDRLIELFHVEEKVGIATAAVWSGKASDFNNENVVKVVIDKDGNALYFSRSPVPYAGWGRGVSFFRHIGIYAFRWDILFETGKLEGSALEEAESLEQLRWMDYGYDIRVIEVDYEPVGVDTPEDLEKVKAIMAGEDEEQ